MKLSGVVKNENLEIFYLPFFVFVFFVFGSESSNVNSFVVTRKGFAVKFFF